jgi:hypothetical protein
VPGGEFEVAIRGPVRKHAQDLIEVGERVEAKQAARGEEAEERGGGLCVGVTAENIPVLAADDDLAQRALRAGVIERQVDVGEDATQLGLLVDGVAEGLGGEVAARRYVALGAKKSSMSGRRCSSRNPARSGRGRRRPERSAA